MARTKHIIDRLPHFFKSEDSGKLLYQFTSVFADLLDAGEEDLLQVMRSHWVPTANNAKPDTSGPLSKGDLDKLFSLFLEKLGGTNLLRQGLRREGEAGLQDDAIYRDRILGLIKVLREGASTREGIKKIVGANLGIIQGEIGAEKALEQIRIEEYLSELISLELDALNGQAERSVKLFEEFDIDAPIIVPAIPNISISIPEDFPSTLINPRIVNLETGKEAHYEGSILANHILNFFSDGSATLNGQRIVDFSGSMPLLLKGRSRWRFEAEVGMAKGLFDKTYFEFAVYEQSSSGEPGVFDQSSFNEAVFSPDVIAANIRMSVSKLHPASFMLVVPWDIVGFTVSIQIPDILPDQVLQNLADQSYTATNIDDLRLTIEGKSYPNIQALYEELLGVFDTELAIRLLGDLQEDLLNSAGAEDMFQAMSINPRRQIPDIVDKVRAAGVEAAVTYEKRFIEQQGLKDILLMQGQLKPSHLTDDIELQEGNIDLSSSQTESEDQELEEVFSLSARFDFARFDTGLNGFA